MGFYATVNEQRDRELKALKLFLAWGLVASLGIHVGLIASGIFNLFAKPSVPDDKEVEITFIDIPLEEKQIKPTPQKIKKIEIPKEEPPQEPLKIPEPLETIVPKPIVPLESTPIPKENITPVVKADPPKPQQTLPVEPEKVVTPPKQPEIKQPEIKQPENLTNPVPDNNVATSQLGEKIIDTPNANGDFKINQQPFNSSQAPTSNQQANNRLRNALKKDGNPTRNRTLITPPQPTSPPQKVATAPTTPNIDPGIGDDNIVGRAACSNCSVSYPSWARRQGVEGRVEVLVDTDPQGRVISVSLLQSSGNSKLDEYHLKRAKRWKLKPSPNGRKGVKIGTEYAMEGSQRYRAVQERGRQETTPAPSQTNVTSSSSSENKPRRRRKIGGTSDE